MSFFDLPMTAGQRDPQVGIDELGRPVFRAIDGTIYGAAFAEPPAPRDDGWKQNMLSAARSGETFDPGLYGVRRDIGGPVNALLEGARGAANALAQGFTAPGRALQGQPVTMGDAFGTALDFGLLGAPMAAPRGAIRAGGMRNADEGFTAYHGSPHDFDRFSMDKIGTGEGAQAYGHGLYFAENEGVARSYRDALTANRLTTGDGQAFDVYTSGGWDDFVEGYISPLAQTAKELPQSADSFGRNSYEGLLDDAYTAIGEGTGSVKDDFADMAKWLRGEGLEKRLDRIRGIPNVAADVPKVLRQQYEAAADLAEEIARGDLNNVPGRMYEVRIKANPDDFLDWDAPLSEQPGVAQRLGLRIKSERELTDEAYALFDQHGSIDQMPPDARTRLDELNAQINMPGTTQTGRELYEFGVGQQENVHDLLRGPSGARSDELRNAGIPGIRYRDAGSRGLDGAEGTRNFVVFDENLIEIVRKYGIAGAAAMLGVSAADIEGAMAGQ